ncbi:MAG: HEAT repeat domain-containing protein, partial [Planctomycetaceae bacterium]
MTTIRSRTLMLCVGSAIAFLAVGSPAFAQPDQTKPANPLIEGLLQRLEKVEAELARLRTQKHVVPTDPKDQKILMMLETPYLGPSQYGRDNNESRFLAAKLIFINLTPNPAAVKRDDISLEIDNNVTFPLKPVTGNLQYQSFQVGEQNYQLSNLAPASELKLVPGRTASTWVVFTDLPGGNQTLQMRIKAKIGGKEQSLDVNEFAMGMLGIEIDRIGPRGSLALVTISGAFNTVNMSGFVDVLDKLTTDKVGRVVVRWTDAATPLDQQVYQWLYQSANQAGVGDGNNGNDQMPAVPAGIRELHLAKVPSSADVSRSAPAEGGSPRVHKTDVEAVSAALQSAYEVLPQDELLREIESGHPLTRAAALANGGGRLPDDKLPVLIRYADDKDPAIQQAALIALRHFGDQQAVEKLLYFVRKNVEPLATTAIESLAASRFAVAQKGLLDILANEGPESKRT